MEKLPMLPKKFGGGYMTIFLLLVVIVLAYSFRKDIKTGFNHMLGDVDDGEANDVDMDKVLKMGVRSQEVIILQNNLNARDTTEPKLNPDGVFGRKTLKALKAANDGKEEITLSEWGSVYNTANAEIETEDFQVDENQMVFN